MKLYTRTGDKGTTGLFGGARIAKDAARVEAYGAVDEANAALGVAAAQLRAAPASDPERVREIEQIQSDMFRLGAELAAQPAANDSDSTATSPAAAVPGRPIDDDDVTRLERWIDERTSEAAPLRRFILPGGTPAAAALHAARGVVRRAERRIVHLAHTDVVREELLRYVNRLSDLLFAMARSENARAGVAETEWRA